MDHARHHPFLEYFLERIPLLKKFPTYFIFFALFGGIATIVDWGLFYLTHLRLGWHYLVSVTLTFILGTLISFSGNKYLNFQDSSKKVIRQYVTFVSLAGGGLLITYGLLIVFIDYLGIHAMLSRAMSTFIVLFYNYNSQKNITFRKTKPRLSLEQPKV